MRIPLLLAASLSLLATGCTDPQAEGTSVTYLSTFDGGTNGLVLHQGGDAGHAGMFGTNCSFSTATGNVTGDYPLPDGEEEEDVQDGEATELGEISLAAIIPGTIHVIDKTGGEYSHIPVPIEGVTEGRLTWDGVVGMTDDCALSWFGLDGAERRTTQLEACGGEFEVDPATGLALVADTELTVVTDGETTTPAEVAGELVAFDNVAQVFYVAQVGQAWLSALELDGTERWTVETAGTVAALDDGGATGTAAVVVTLAEGTGAVAFYDGLTGEPGRYAETPSTAEDLSVSGNGSVVALVRPEQTFFYALGD